MRKISALIAAATALAAFVIPQSASAACGAVLRGTVAKKMKHELVTADAVDPKKTDVYTVTLTAGDHYIAVWSPGDIDLYICKGKSTTPTCTSHNPAAFPDACAASDLEGNPGMGAPIRGPGTFKIHVQHCTSAACGYEDVPAPLPYVLFVG